MTEKLGKAGYPLLVLTGYMIIGAVCGLWHPGWILLLAIPLENIASHDGKSGAALLGNPVFLAAVYLILGFTFGIWHPGWVIFLLVPLVPLLLRAKRN